MQLDGMTEDDVERLFGKNRHVDLRTINLEMGDKTMYVWIFSGIRKAMEDGREAYQIPSYLDCYIKQRYEQYKGGDHG